MSHRLSLFKWKKEKSPATTTTPTCPEGSVPLHILCDNCQKFSRKWRVVDQIITLKKDFIKSLSQLDKGDSRYTLCTVAYLAATAESCHLCMFFLSLIQHHYSREQLDSDPNQELHFGVSTWYETNVEISVNLGSTENNRAVFDVYAIGPNRSYGFYSLLSSSHVPIRPQDNLAQAKEWIRTCLSEHDKCSRFQQLAMKTNRRPTRVLEITSNHVRLRCDMPSSGSYEYVTLSHMWGPNPQKQLRLLESRLEEFQSAIPQEEMSHIYREAIRVTQNLGYSYLWIDSLCIIQDSRSDWNQEASHMATVYGNAVCNLAFLFPLNDTETRTRGDPRIYSSCVLRPATAKRRGVYVSRHKHNIVLSPEASHGSKEEKSELGWLDRHHWPLFSRAWTFQEHLLCPRTIFYGHKNLMWECSELFSDELLGPVVDQWHDGVDKWRLLSDCLQALPDTSRLTAPSVISFTRTWFKLIDEYRLRALTNPKDRIIAFAGITRAIHNISGWTHLAGMWGEIFPLCLLWSIESVYEGMRTSKTDEPVVHSAPSWSWFSVPLSVQYYINMPFDTPLHLSTFQGNAFDRQDTEVYDIFWPQRFSYQSCDGVLTETSFHDFAGLQVNFDTMVLVTDLNWEIDDDVVTNGDFFDLLSRLDNLIDFELEFYPDNVARTYARLEGFLRLALIVEIQVRRFPHTGGINVHHDIAGIAIAPNPETGYWRRIGMWVLKVKIRGDEALEQQDVTSIFKSLGSVEMIKITLE